MKTAGKKIAVLSSGGIDSSILIQKLLDENKTVYPIYISSGNLWERAEQWWLRQFLKTRSRDRLKPLVLLSFPMRDVYENSWSVSGKKIPGKKSRDEAVYLPGKNVILIAKTAIYCMKKNIRQIALAPLKTNPFRDASREFFDQYERALSIGLGFPIKIRTPFLSKTKKQVMEIGKGFPLELTFSCLNPRRNLHCGKCNKCAERKSAFRSVRLPDLTKYDA